MAQLLTKTRRRSHDQHNTNDGSEPLTFVDRNVFGPTALAPQDVVHDRDHHDTSIHSTLDFFRRSRCNSRGRANARRILGPLLRDNRFGCLSVISPPTKIVICPATTTTHEFRTITSTSASTGPRTSRSKKSTSANRRMACQPEKPLRRLRSPRGPHA